MFTKTSFACLVFLLIFIQIGNAQITFTDVATSVGITATGGASFGFFDYDNDNNLDIYLQRRLNSSYLYKNNGAVFNFTFSDVTASAGLMYNSPGNSGPALIDYNNDGYIDIFLSNQGAKVLYKNNGDGTFSDVTSASGITESGTTNGKAFGDYNNDGYLDLYLVSWSTGPAVLYKNNGPPNWDFTEVTSTAGVGVGGACHGCVFVDYNNDGNQDIYVSIYYGTNVLYRNNGDGTFSNVTSQSGLGAGSRCRGIVFGDYNNDGYLDLYITRGVFHSLYSNILFKNNGPPNWNFTDVSSAAGVGSVGDGSISAFGDYDNDGDLDIVVANVYSPGYTRSYIPTDNVLYKNNGDGTFTDVATTAGVVNPKGCGIMAFGDYNDDGFLDIYAPDNYGAHILYKNSGNSNNWLKIKLVGSVSNKDGIGSRISITSGGLTQIREVDGGNLGMVFQCSQPIHFGIGGSNQIDQIEVKWPSGIVSTLTNIAANQTLTIFENRDPIANAGADQTVEATSPAGAEITLDGSDSFDPDNDPLTYTWSENGDIIAGPTSSPTSQVTLTLGTHTILLTVDDGNGGTDTDEVIIQVQDTTPPEISVSVIPNQLWPPNHKMVDITTTVAVSDICDENPNWMLLSVESNEPEEGPGKKNYPDIMGDDVGTADTEFQLRAERLGKGAGRIYTITYEATDASRNSATTEATVTVPHDLGKQIASLSDEFNEPDSYQLFANYPNPFNPETSISYKIPEAAHVQLKIYNAIGNEITTLANARQNAGYYTVLWNGKDCYGKKVVSGIYFYQIKAGVFVKSRKMALLR